MTRSSPTARSVRSASSAPINCRQKLESRQGRPRNRRARRVSGAASSCAWDNPESIAAGSQALGAPVIPLDEDLELIGVEDRSALDDAHARLLDALTSARDWLAAPVLVSRVLLCAHWLVDATGYPT
jgi:hypothetical protein